MRFVIALFVVLLLTPLDAAADCVWDWVCDGQGNCSHVPICDSSIDLVPPEPPSIEPISPPGIQPIQPPGVPPIGTTECTKVQRQDPDGTWYWDTVCY